MPNDYFAFKKFTIHQDNCAMKVGTDGVLLGAWVNTGAAESILDIGTGTGLITLMLAQRSNARIDAIDIDKSAVKQAEENVAGSPWKSRIHIIHESLQSFSKKNSKYDLLVTNPPYYSNALKAPDEKRSMARHNYKLRQSELIEGILRLLNPGGSLGIILPVPAYELFLKELQNTGLHETRKTLVIPSPGKNPLRVLAEFSFTKRIPELSALIIEKYGRHDYSEEYIELTKDYYLNF
jgi:tRNA1Val (adenine37-N6)-methyltransferase